MTDAFRATLWIVLVGSLVGLFGTLAWRRIRPRFYAFVVNATLRASAALLRVGAAYLKGIFAPDTLTGPTSAGIEAVLYRIAEAIEEIERRKRDIPQLGPSEGLISWNLPKAMPRWLSQDVEVRISRDTTLKIHDHRANLKGGGAAKTENVTVGSKMAVKLDAIEENGRCLTINTVSITEQDILERGFTSWFFNIRGNRRGWYRVRLIATMIEPHKKVVFFLDPDPSIRVTGNFLLTMRRIAPTKTKAFAAAAVSSAFLLVGDIIAGDVIRPVLKDYIDGFIGFTETPAGTTVDPDTTRPIDQAESP